MDFLRLGGFWVLVPCTARKKSSCAWSSCWVHAPSNIKRSTRIWFVACIFFLVGYSVCNFFRGSSYCVFLKCFGVLWYQGGVYWTNPRHPPKLKFHFLKFPNRFFWKKSQNGVTACEFPKFRSEIADTVPHFVLVVRRGSEKEVFLWASYPVKS